MQQPPPNQRALSMADRSARSVFIGNISYDVTEAQLRQLFSRAGQVVHLRVVHDRETGRPKGYGFCEFTDPQIAETAQRTLNGYEMNGRQLRVDSATGGERSADEVQQFQMGLSGGPGTASQAGGGPAAAAEDHQSSPYGPEPEAGKAPEAIARTVASLPPERMFELMRQMKETVLNNSMLARTLLMENPQLAYALLQAQVVMRIVDPKVAYSMLHREQPLSTPFHQQVPPGSAGPQPTAGGVTQANVPSTGFPPASMPPSGGQSQQFHRQMPPSSAYGNFGGMMPLQQAGMPSRMPPPMQRQAAAPVANNDASNNSGADSAADEEQQAQMLVKVLQLTEEQIQLLPPDDRVKVIELRKQLRQQLPSA